MFLTATSPLTHSPPFPVPPNFTALYMTAARLIWAFTFHPSTDPSTGSSCPPDASIETGYTSGFNIRPHPFECRIVPRSESVKHVCERENMEALESLRLFEENGE